MVDRNPPAFTIDIDDKSSIRFGRGFHSPVSTLPDSDMKLYFEAIFLVRACRGVSLSLPPSPLSRVQTYSFQRFTKPTLVQNIHSKRVTAKILQTKELRLSCASKPEKPGAEPGFFSLF
jgi:hypothetical protein